MTPDAERYVGRLKAVAAVGATIASVDALDVVLDRIVHETALVMNAKVCAIVLLDEPRESVTVAAMHGFEALAWRVPAPDAASWQAMATGRAFEVLDSQFDTRFPSLQDFARRAGTHTFLSVPLIAHTRTLGALDIHSADIRHVDAQDVQLLHILAGQGATALENARLYESLDRERRLLATVVEGTQDALILENAAGEVVWANKAAGQLLSEPAAALTGANMASVYDGLAGRARDPDETREELSSAVRRHDRFPIDLHLSQPRFDLRVQIMQVGRDERAQPGFLHVIRDVGPERAADRARNVLLSSVSHELRTPLTNIKGFISTLLLENAAWDAATQRDFLIEIEAEADHLGELVGNLLDTSRLEAGVLQVNRRWSDLQAVLARVVEQLRRNAPSQGIDIRLPDRLPPIFIDTDRIAQVTRNILDNSLKYTPAGTSIELTACLAGEEIVVSVTDSGPGVRADAQDRIFEPFYRCLADGQQVPGTGLGLAICKGLVEAHGGRIWAESRPAGGTRISFSLPLVDKAMAPRATGAGR